MAKGSSGENGSNRVSKGRGVGSNVCIHPSLGHSSSAQLNLGENHQVCPLWVPQHPRWEEGVGSPGGSSGCSPSSTQAPRLSLQSGNPDPAERAPSPGLLQVPLPFINRDVLLSRERGEEEVEGSQADEKAGAAADAGRTDKAPGGRGKQKKLVSCCSHLDMKIPQGIMMLGIYTSEFLQRVVINLFL